MKKHLFVPRLKSLGARITVFYLAVGLLVLLLFGGTVYYAASKILVNETLSKTELVLEKAANQISSEIRHAEDILRLLSMTPGFTESLLASSEEDRIQAVEWISTIKKNNAYIFSVFAAFENGKALGEKGGVAFFDDIDYETLSMNGLPFISTQRTEQYPHNDGCVVTLGIPLSSEESGQTGVLAMDLDYCLLGKAAKTPDFGCELYIEDQASGEMIFTNSGTAQNGEMTWGYDPQSNTLTQSYPIEGTEWRIIGRAYLDGLDALKRQLMNIVLITGALLLFSLVLITAYYSRKLITPLTRLSKKMEEIADLKELTVVSNELSETKQLAESYNRMIGKIKQLMAELEQKQTELRQSEIDALTNQINPHFLYNTLDTIVWLAEFKDNEKIIALTKSLAAFFRLSLNGGRAEVRLYDEIEHVKQYLFIQKERYGDKLTYSFDIDYSLADCSVPKIILQPLVENSIYHGIKPMDGVGHIEVCACLDNNEVLITVKDNGVGFDSDSEYKSEKISGGVGLCNIEKRLKLFFGPDAKMEVKSSKGNGTVVTLRFALKD